MASNSVVQEAFARGFAIGRRMRPGINRYTLSRWQRELRDEQKRYRTRDDRAYLEGEIAGVQPISTGNI